MGLIYVNPEGHLADGDPEQSARDIREVFARWVVMVVMVMVALLARMGMDDEEAVALIGGGHGVGKAHGACPLGAGPAPSEDPFNPWPGRCGAGKLEEAFTSGLELPWTTRPTSWDNEFFSNLLDYEWELHEVSSSACLFVFIWDWQKNPKIKLVFRPYISYLKSSHLEKGADSLGKFLCPLKKDPPETLQIKP